MVHYNEVLYTKVTVTFGLYERCQLTLSEFPSPGEGKGKISYENYECRHFPGSVTDKCEKENKSFCSAWISAGYIDELAIGFASVSLVAILFGVTTHSRRRRIWRAVFWLVLFQGNVAQISINYLRSLCCFQLSAKYQRLRSSQTCTTIQTTHPLTMHAQVSSTWPFLTFPLY